MTRAYNLQSMVEIPSAVNIRKFLQDQILTLAAASRLESRSDIFWLTKLEFFRRHSLESKGSNTPVPFWGWFLRNTYGPVCPQVYDTTARLIECGFLEEDEQGRARLITNHGIKLFSALEQGIDRFTLTDITFWAGKLKVMTFKQLKNLVYETEVPYGGKLTKVRDVPQNASIYGYPNSWRQIVPDDVLRAFQASLQVRRPSQLADVRDFEELARAFG